MVKYQNISTSNKWRMDVEEQLEDYHNPQDCYSDNQDTHLGYDY